MRTLAILPLVLALAYPADAHCFRVWRYPFAQRGCQVHTLPRVVARIITARVTPPVVPSHVVTTPEAWSVEITRIPPLTDDELHQLGIEKLKEKAQ
jgi:hypothetical protein